jgi:pyrroline-5-carboxylate reductase
MKIAIIGAGAMGGSFAEGLLKGSIFNPSDITIANPHKDKLQRFSNLGTNTTTNNIEAIKDADIIAIVVKPWLVEQVINEIKDSIDYNHQIIINMAAAIKADTLFSWLDKNGQKPVLFQVIPNIAIAQKASMTFIVPC